MAWRLFLVLAYVPALSGCFNLSAMTGESAWFKSYLARVSSSTDLGQARFLLDDFNSLNDHSLQTNASPWKIYSTALLMAEAPRLGLPIDRSSLPTVLEQYGFFVPTRIGNWDSTRSPEPKLLSPMGMVRGIVRGRVPGVRLEVSNLNCAACHAGKTYDSRGNPLSVAWLGLPNTSINIEGFVAATYAGLKLGAKDERRFVDTIRKVYPDMSGGEDFTIRRFILPVFREKMGELMAGTDRALPFNNGGPGMTNGLSALKFQVGYLKFGTFAPGEAAFTSIPELGHRAFRTSLLADGAYARPGQPRFAEIKRSQATVARMRDLAHITAFFTVPVNGNSFETAAKLVPEAQEIMGTLHRYESPRFPGVIDVQRARRGAQVYQNRCAECHGTYSWGGNVAGAARPQLESYPNRLVPQNQMGTDALRWKGVHATLIREIAREPKNRVFFSHVAPSQTGGYVAPLLSGVWATAPYLHNGSVPTLWHLMNPDRRPVRFEVGGHRLDFHWVGIAGALSADGTYRYSSAYRPWSKPAVYDTRARGLSNAGHRMPFDEMSADEKKDVLEFLKLL